MEVQNRKISNKNIISEIVNLVEKKVLEQKEK